MPQRKQLVARGESLLARMLAANDGSTREVCPQVGRTRAEFRKGRATSWELLATREACLLEAEMREKRAKPKAKARLCADPYGRVRAQMATRKSAAYLANALAVVAAEEKAY